MSGRTNFIREGLLVGSWSPQIRKVYAVSAGLVLFFFPFSLLFIVGGLLPASLAWTASVVIALYAMTTLLSEMRDQTVGTVLRRFLLCSATLLCVEYIGVKSGLPFGRYHYTDALGFTVLGVPLAIPLAWYTTIITTWRLAQEVTHHSSGRTLWKILVGAGILTIVLDLLLEPMASMVKGYWMWAGDVVPLQNYASWFVFSILAVRWLQTGPGSEAPPSPGHRSNAILVLGTEAVLFSSTDMVHGYGTPVAISALLLAFFWIARIAGPAGLPLGEVTRR
jgi:uncharacterized membrane protein